MNIFRLFTVFGFALAVAQGGEPRTPPRLDRFNLLEYRDEKGKVAPVRTIQDWRKRRDEILAGAHAVMGPLPSPDKRVSLDVKVEKEKEFPRYIRQRISYISEPQAPRVPAYVFIPKSVFKGNGADRRAGVLCLMGTGGHKLEDISPSKGVTNNTQDGEKLAERGFVAIAPAYPSLGLGARSGVASNYSPDLKALGYRSGTMKAIWDNMRALDVLSAMPFVKASGFGAIGHSLGGHNSIYTAVFDERIKVVVSSCGFDSFLDYIPRAWGPGKGWAQELYMPRILDYSREEIPFDFHELIGSLAPRAVFVNAPTRDGNFPQWGSIDKIAAAALAVYRLHGVPDLIKVVHPDVGHDFPATVREEAYDWFEQFL